MFKADGGNFLANLISTYLTMNFLNKCVFLIHCRSLLSSPYVIPKAPVTPSLVDVAGRVCGELQPTPGMAAVAALGAS